MRPDYPIVGVFVGGRCKKQYAAGAMQRTGRPGKWTLPHSRADDRQGEISPEREHERGFNRYHCLYHKRREHAPPTYRAT